ncbi:oligosaccharide flippase family protein [Alicyclobacillus dauci]|uniref:Oligosaccharide flippase family protein n=1 Tax=Alicyclobacillus dauci TaxID=1475485 RepID=A0ABY6Z2I8_9BACL|nr:oligosaccharide flippase family protein [Alicyclobacillus dauci]WAH36823.1 oligosaccharide flippase family protein [Alicyclobacillus dauci]
MRLGGMSSDSYSERFLKAVVIIGSSSLISMILGVIVSKFRAIILGPSGLGIISISSGFIGVVSTLSLFGMDVLIVQDNNQTVNYKRALNIVTIWFIMILLVLATLYIVDKRALFQFNGLNPIDWFLLTLAAFLSSLATLQVAITSRQRNLKQLANQGMFSALGASCVSVLIILVMREKGIVLSIVLGTLCNLLVVYLVGNSRNLWSKHSPHEKRKNIGRELTDGAILTTTRFVEAGVQWLIPILVAYNYGVTTTGFFQCAIIISTTYLGLLNNVMSQEFFPSITQMPISNIDKIEERCNEQQLFITLISVPVILIVLGFSPYGINVIFSSAFLPAVTILKWQLVADILKFASWSYGYLILAKASRGYYAATHLTWSFSYLFAAIVFPRFLGLEGYGIAILFAFLVHYLMVVIVVYLKFKARVTLNNSIILALCVVYSAFMALVVDDKRVSLANSLLSISGAFITILFLVLNNKTRKRFFSLVYRR